MIDSTDAGLLLEMVNDLDRYLFEAKVPSNNPDRVKHAVLRDKLQDTINSPQVDVFTVEETKQLRILIAALMARIGGSVKINIDDFINEANSDPDAYKLEIIPDANGTVVELKWTGNVKKNFTTDEFKRIMSEAPATNATAVLGRPIRGSARNP